MTTSADRAWEIIEKVSICMLTTRTTHGEFRGRPVEARPCREEGCVYVVTDFRSAKEYEIERDPHLGLTFIDQQTNAYLSIAGHGAITTNPSQVKRWWRSTDSVWWKGPDDPNVCVLQAALASASLWDGPSSKAVAIFEFVKAKSPARNPISVKIERPILSLVRADKSSAGNFMRAPALSVRCRGDNRP